MANKKKSNGPNHTDYTREDIYDLLHSTIPTKKKRIAERLGIDDIYGIGRISDGRVILGQRMLKLQEEGAIDSVPYSGWILKERIPLKENQ